MIAFCKRFGKSQMEFSLRLGHVWCIAIDSVVLVIWSVQIIGNNVLKSGESRLLSWVNLSWFARGMLSFSPSTQISQNVMLNMILERQHSCWFPLCRVRNDSRAQVVQNVLCPKWHLPTRCCREGVTQRRLLSSVTWTCLYLWQATYNQGDLIKHICGYVCFNSYC